MSIDIGKMENKIQFYYPGIRPEKADPKSGPDCWVIKTYDKLQHSGCTSDIKLVSEIPDTGITIFHKGLFPKGLRPSKKQYFVCIQADYGRYRFAQYHIHQNPAGPRNFGFSKRAFVEDLIFPFTGNSFMPHWNQDDIIPRDSVRGTHFENIVFMGLEKNFPQELTKGNFINRLNEMGLKLKLITDDSSWSDYSEADCVLAIRDLNAEPHYNKPSSKIINALLAGVPVVAGHESSALYLKRRHHVAIECVQDEDALIRAIIKIRSAYSDALEGVKESNKKLDCYHDKSIITQWVELFEELRKCYHRWSGAAEMHRQLFYKYSRI
jgi:hypothetical protein